MMENRSSSKLKQRVARMIQGSSLLGSSCNSSTTATILSSASTASNQTLTSHTTHEPVFISRPLPHLADVSDDLLSFRSSPGDHRRRRFSANCGGCRPSRSSEACRPPRMVKNGKKERRVRETGEFYETGEREGRTCPPASPTSPSSSSNNYYYYHYFKQMENKMKSTNQKKKKKLLSNGYGFTSSSSESSDDEFGFFSSEEREEEEEIFFSSRSFSSDSSEFYHRPSSNPNKTKKTKNKKKKKKSSRRPPRRMEKSNEDRFSVSSGREEGGVAVVKRSSDPYSDFRSSMLEMIVERQMFGAEELEFLLQSYLSLNSPCHHQVILKAFTDIWEVLFSC